MRSEPLSRFPALRTRDVDELRQRMAGLFSVCSMDLGRGGQATFEGCLNLRQMRDVGVGYARYGSLLAVCLSHGDTYLQGFPIRGHGSVVNDGAEGEVSPGNGTACGPNADMRIKYSSDFEHLFLRIKPQKLIKTLSGLIGRPVETLRIATNDRPSPAMAVAQRRLVEFVVSELDRVDAPLPTLVLAELEQALVVSYLKCNLHSYSHLLEEDPVRSVAPWQVRLAEDYIEQNWDQPVTVEALAHVANAGVRSLFFTFQKSRGVSPMAFVRQVRLRHAKEMLTRATPETTVTSVAYACGFSNLGHFAKYYHAAFGEHPSATLKIARRLPAESDQSAAPTCRASENEHWT
jgi:AraC-like DNA-binding protein